MGREFSAMEDEFELSLELSIGGCHAKSEKRKNVERETREKSEENLSSRSDFACGKSDLAAEKGCEFFDLQKRREIQAFRRPEARMKREVKKSTEMNNGGFMEDKLTLEAQQFQTRVEDRESREKDGIFEDFTRKNDEHGRKRVVEDLNISLFNENENLGRDFASNQMQTQFLFPTEVQYAPIATGFAYPCAVVPLWGPTVVGRERNETYVFRPVANRTANSCDSGNEAENWEVLSRRSVERSSSVVSDHPSGSQKGGSGSDSGIHSVSLGTTHQNHCVSNSDKIDHFEVYDSSSQTESGQCVGSLNQENGVKAVSPIAQQITSSTSKTSERSKSHSQSNQTCSTTEKSSSPLSKETSGVISIPPNHCQNGASVPHMPCVTTTGNGPNGKTITGFLYKYTKSEVCIMCVCHGSSFSPAEFVEHAGGVDISHPLKHITIVPSALG